jgi:hypothetical protein
VLYSVSFKEFQLKKRLDALKGIGLTIEFHSESNTVDITHNQCDVLGSTHKEAARFICDPVYNPVMYNMDSGMCAIVAELHYEFWCWRQKRAYVIPEEAIANGIKGYFEQLECTAQDAWLEKTPKEIEDIVIDLGVVFNEEYWRLATVPHHFLSSLAGQINYDHVDWHRVHRFIFS